MPTEEKENETQLYIRFSFMFSAVKMELKILFPKSIFFFMKNDIRVSFFFFNFPRLEENGIRIHFMLFVFGFRFSFSYEI